MVFSMHRNRLFLRFALIGALAAAFGLAGCGRKGPLDPPPASLTDQHPASTTAAKPAQKPATSHNPLDVLLN